MAAAPLGGLLGAILALTGQAPATPTAPTPPPSTSTVVPVTPVTSAPYTGTPPKVGECRDMTYDGFQSSVDTSTVVPCSKTHNAVVIAVPTLPSSYDPATWTDAQTNTAAAQLCVRAAAPWFKAPRYRRVTTLWQLGVFVPHSTELSGGARWVECVVAVPSKIQGRLLPLPKHVRKPLLKTKHADVANLCLVGRSAIVSCQESHDFRVATKPLRVHHKKPLTRAQFRRAAQGCARVTHSRYWTAWKPTDAAWRSGDRFLVCFRATRI